MIPISDNIKSPAFPLFNLLLIAATSFVFLIQLSVSSQDAFIARYSLIPGLVNFNNIHSLYPFITAIFLHGGFLHIIFNMLFLWVFGDNVEGYLGKIKFLFLYFASGIAGNFLQYSLMPQSTIPMLGASGAIAGILGSYFVLFPYAKIRTLVPIGFLITTINIPAPIMLGYWFLLQVISGAFSLSGTLSEGGIAFFAHVGGFVTGYLLTKFVLAVSK